MYASEIDPVVLTVGPATFVTIKITCSLIFTLFAKLHANLRRGDITLTVFFGSIAGWNLSQHQMAYLNLKNFAYGISLGTMFNLSASDGSGTLFISENWCGRRDLNSGLQAWKAYTVTVS